MEGDGDEPASIVSGVPRPSAAYNGRYVVVQVLALGSKVVGCFTQRRLAERAVVNLRRAHPHNAFEVREATAR